MSLRMLKKLEVEQCCDALPFGAWNMLSEDQMMDIRPGEPDSHDRHGKPEDLIAAHSEALSHAGFRVNSGEIWFNSIKLCELPDPEMKVTSIKLSPDEKHLYISCCKKEAEYKASIIVAEVVVKSDVVAIKQIEKVDLEGSKFDYGFRIKDVTRTSLLLTPYYNSHDFLEFDLATSKYETKALKNSNETVMKISEKFIVTMKGNTVILRENDEKQKTLIGIRREGTKVHGTGIFDERYLIISRTNLKNSKLNHISVFDISEPKEPKLIQQYDLKERIVAFSKSGKEHFVCITDKGRYIKAKLNQLGIQLPGPVKASTVKESPAKAQQDAKMPSETVKVATQSVTAPVQNTKTHNQTLWSKKDAPTDHRKQAEERYKEIKNQKNRLSRRTS